MSSHPLALSEPRQKPSAAAKEHVLVSAVVRMCLCRSACLTGKSGSFFSRVAGGLLVVVRQLEGEQEFAVDVGEQGKADHGERLQVSDGNKMQRWRVGQSEKYFSSKQQTTFYFPVTESIVGRKNHGHVRP